MATVGNTTTPGPGWQFVGINVQNQVATAFVMPTPGGRITNLHAYFDVNSGGPVGCFCCLWDSPGNLLASVAVGPVPNGAHSGGGQQFWTGALATPIYVKGGSSIWLGFWFPQGNGGVWSYETSGSAVFNTSAGSPGSLSGNSPTGGGALAAFADYVPLLIKRRKAGVWVEAPIRRRKAGAWVTPAVFRRKAGAWVQVQ